MTVFSGNYKVEIFDKNINDFVPTVYGLGMHVEIRDPDDKIILSRVRWVADPLTACFTMSASLLLAGC